MRKRWRSGWRGQSLQILDIDRNSHDLMEAV
jgi:hypothetical protein